MRNILIYMFGFILVVGTMLTGNDRVSAAKDWDCEITIDANKHTDGNYAILREGSSDCDMGQVAGYWNEQGFQLSGSYSGFVENGQIVSIGAGNSNLLIHTIAKKKPVVTTKSETKKESIAYKTVKQNDSSIKKGQTKVKTNGKKGTKEIVYEVTYTDGKETSRKKVSEKVTVKPVNKVVLIGTKVESKPKPNKPSTSKPSNSGNSSSSKGNSNSSSEATSSSSGSSSKTDQIDKGKETSQETVKDSEKSKSKEKSKDKDDVKDKGTDKGNKKDKDKVKVDLTEIDNKSGEHLTLSELKQKENVSVREKDDKYYAVYKDKEGNKVKQEIDKEEAKTLTSHIEDNKETRNGEAQEDAEKIQVKDSEQEKSSFGIMWIVLVVLVLGLGGYGIYYYYKRKK